MDQICDVMIAVDEYVHVLVRVRKVPDPLR